MQTHSGLPGVITINEVSSAVYGTYRLARRDPGGLAFLDRSPEGVVKSFAAALLLFPLDMALTLASRWQSIATMPMTDWFLLESIFYVIEWTLFPVLMIPISRWIDRWGRFHDFLVIYNWSHILIFAVRLPLRLLLLGGLPLPLFQVLALGLLAAILYYKWYYFKLSLDLTGGMAAALVASQYVLALVVFQVSDTIVYGE